MVTAAQAYWLNRKRRQARNEGVGGPQIVLSANTIAENAANGTNIGTFSVSGGSGTYTWSEIADPGSKFSLSGAILQKAAALDYDTAPTWSYTVEADNGVDDPIQATVTIYLTNVLEVTLNALTIDDDDAVPGEAWSATITGKSSGSTITATSSDGTVLSVVSTTVSGTFTVEGTPNVTLHETHADGSNSPRDSVIAVTVSDVVTIGAPLDVTVVEPVTNPPQFNMNSRWDAPGEVQVGYVPQVRYNGAGTIYDGTPVASISIDPPDFSGASLPTQPTGAGYAQFRYVWDEGGPGEVIGDWSSASEGAFDIEASFAEQGTVLDGTTYLSRTGGLIGAVDSPTGTYFISIGGSTTGDELLLSTNKGAVKRIANILAAFDWADTSDTHTINVLSASDWVVGARLNVLVKFDADGTSQYYAWNTTKGSWALAVDDASGGGVALDWTTSDWGILAQFDGSSKSPATFYRAAFWPGVAADISDSAVRALFSDATTGVLVDPAVSVAALGTPKIDIYGDAATLNGGTGNHGDGGAWAVVGGTVTDA